LVISALKKESLFEGENGLIFYSGVIFGEIWG
jgi:hypothetical protein